MNHEFNGMGAIDGLDVVCADRGTTYQRVEEGICPPMNIVRMYVRSHAEHARTALGARHNERCIDRIGDTLHIIRIHVNGFRQLLGSAGKLA